MTYAACPSLYDHQFNTLQGEKINLCDYQSKPILVVNTASKCGFTPQFNALEALYKKYQLPLTGMEAVTLPSTSPANAAWTFEKLCAAWGYIIKV